jgi:hypothetical protein
VCIPKGIQEIPCDPRLFVVGPPSVASRGGLLRDRVVDVEHEHLELAGSDAGHGCARDGLVHDLADGVVTKVRAAESQPNGKHILVRRRLLCLCLLLCVRLYVGNVLCA